MRLLLDTQIALWWLAGSPKLKRATRERLATTECLISVASIWEVAIKHRIGKLAIAPHVFSAAMRDCGALVLPIGEAHVAGYVQLPAGHADPFDLLLIAVAQTEKLQLLTADKQLIGYASALPAGTVEAAV